MTQGESQPETTEKCFRCRKEFTDHEEFDMHEEEEMDDL